MDGPISKLASLVVGLIYLVAGVIAGGPVTLVQVAIFLVLPLSCIWFGEELGSLTGIMRGTHVSQESPGCLVAAAGWLLLLSPIVMGIIWYLRRPQ